MENLMGRSLQDSRRNHYSLFCKCLCAAIIYFLDICDILKIVEFNFFVIASVSKSGGCGITSKAHNHRKVNLLIFIKA